MLSDLLTAMLLLLLLFLTTFVILLLGGLGLLSPHTTRATSTEWRCKREVNVLLGIKTDNERWDVDDLLADTRSDVSSV
jgi:cell division protein FtsX